MSLIIPYLYLGSIDEASNMNWLRDNDIKVILNVASEVPLYSNCDIKTYKIYLNDSPLQDILPILQYTYSIIDEAIKNRKNILVHCYAGISRSASIVIAYLIMKYGISLQDVYNYVKSKRNIINPNYGFIEQLKIL